MYLVSNPTKELYRRVSSGSVVTIGAYDGLHLGHQKLLSRVVAEARERALPAVVMSFEPTPKEYFAGDNPPARLMRFREKFEALAEAGIDIFYCPRFNQAMSAITADTFVRQLLIHALNVRHLVIGDDFRFAVRREGNIELLKRAGKALEFSVEQVASITVGDERVSSTAIRQALMTGDMRKAQRLLGRDYRMSGKVVRGESMGRKLGYPTANVNLKRRLSPVFGIFAVRVSGLGKRVLDGVASVGTRPTFQGTKPLLEVHIFDFDEDIYGRRIHVDFVARLRSEEKFDDVQELVEQMHRDSAAAREILAA
ncbi:bifunctional riboflavin kinase/FAD synthetase [Woeseia oceani]|uniref:Riboflavin biosynthesis protein n=1 Tax=Woeseia oceani TaxID=1548547 RepID=A0A193LKT4_9GAMM|nr:bifunctional riboflavin kinase/FAD synthetase [Woeseia oceani]ANO53180.1 riboflavin biosynthesis protein RibF [Woeseia oceani]